MLITHGQARELVAEALHAHGFTDREIEACKEEV
jgi:hypothetical protein